MQSREMIEMVEIDARVAEELNDENRGTVDQRVAVIKRRGEYAEDLAKLQRRIDAERERTGDTSDG